MKALVYEGPNKLVLKDRARPQRKEGEVLIKIRACGICGSDVEGYLGKSGRRTAPMVMGHEFSGEIIEVDKDSDLSVGDKVTAYPKLYCGECEYCKKGLTNICPEADFLGAMDTDGAMKEYLSIDEKYVIKADDNIDYIDLSMVEPLAVAYRSTTKVTDNEIKNAKNILIIGAGTIGLFILQVLKIKGAKNIIVSDLSDYRLKLAKKLGASSVLNPKKSEFKEKIEKITNNEMIDYSFEAVGFSSTASQALNSLKVGGTSIWVGNAQKMIEVNMQQIVTTELNIKGNYIYSEKDFKNCLQLIEEDKIDIDSLISIKTDLSNGKTMFEKLVNENKDGKIIK
ncbi:MAG: zinc-dependent alcohol dehydrogenase, partial [Halanaerobiales bacterium]